MKNNENLDKSNQLYYQVYLKCNGNENEIKKVCSFLEINLKDFFQNVLNHINDHVSLPDYAIALNKILDLQTEQEIIEYINSFPQGLKYLNNNLYSYFIYYRPDIYYLSPKLKESLKQKLDIYYRYQKDLDKPEKITENKGSLDYAVYIIKSFIESPYTAERFCFNKNISKTDFKRYVTTVKNTNPTLYNQYFVNNSLKEERKEREIQNDVYLIIDKLHEMEGNFSLIDLLQLTTYSIKELIKTADNILDVETVKFFRNHISRFNVIKNYRVLSANEINRLFNSTYILNINGKLTEISTEDKQAVIGFLQEKNIPITNETYLDAINRFYQNELFTQKYR